MIRALFPLILAFSSLSSFATEVQSKFLELGSQIPGKLMELGYTRLGDIQLAPFIEDIKAVSVREASLSEIAERNCDGRTSARWNKNGGIMVDGDDVDAHPREAAILALHEYSQMKGYYDDQYWISMSMWFLTLPSAQKLLTAKERGRIEQWVAKNSKLRYAKGSIVGIGGGGEIMTLVVRTRRIDRIMDDVRKSKNAQQRNEALNELSIALSSNLSVMYTQAAKRCR